MTGVNPRTARRPVRVLTAALACVGLLAAAGCELRPGVAAEVGDTRISVERVDAVASAICAANLSAAEAQGAPAQEIPTAGPRIGALQVLISSEVSRQLGEALDIEAAPGELSAALAQNDAGIAALPADRREVFRETLRDFTEGQLILIGVGRAALGAVGQTDVTDDEALAEGTRIQAAYLAEEIDVRVDPRFGEIVDGQLVPGDTDLSVAQSQRAVDADAAQPDPSYVSSLPVSLLCS